MAQSWSLATKGEKNAKIGSPPFFSEELYTVNEVARDMRIDRATVRRWIAAGMLNAVQVSTGPSGLRKIYRIPKSAIAEMMQKAALK